MNKLKKIIGISFLNLAVFAGGSLGINNLLNNNNSYMDGKLYNVSRPSGLISNTSYTKNNSNQTIRINKFLTHNLYTDGFPGEIDDKVDTIVRSSFGDITILSRNDSYQTHKTEFDQADKELQIISKKYEHYFSNN
jgi:hypothetical protein